MRKRSSVIALLAGALIAIPAHAAQAQLTIAKWDAGVYAQDYTQGPDEHCTIPNYCYTQAGGHPFVGVTDFTIGQNADGSPDGTVSNVRVDIPPGLISNPQAVPYCTTFPVCPNNTQLGIVELEAFEPVLGVGTAVYVGTSVYNTQPPAGEVSDYAFNTLSGRVDIIGGIRSATDDGLYFTIAAPASPQLVKSTLIFWGVPGDSGHASQLDWSCGLSGLSFSPCVPPASSPGTPSGTPFLSNPSGCVPAGQVSTLAVDSTLGDHVQATTSTPVPATNCSSVPFQPSLSITPQTTQSDAPTGMAVDVHVPQTNDDPSGLASATLQNAVVTMPPGMTLDPSAATGLQACSPAQFGKGSDAPPTCPGPSQIGTVEIDTPLLPNPLTGSVYLGCDGPSPQTPCPASGGFAYLYIYATAPQQGITQKLIGTVTTDPNTGQVTNTFVNQPQVPFTDFKLVINGGPTAPLANPLACGPATTTSSLTPYSGNPAVTPAPSTFTVDSNGAGGACLSSPPFAPGFSVSTHTSQAGAFDNPLIQNVTRPDGAQYLSRIAVQMPPGLLGVVANVPLCPEPQASQGTCPAASQIGTSTALAGSGPDSIPETGSVSLTGPYNGAPFGLSVVLPTVAGPFNLGNVVVRAAINVDRNDGHVTITSDPLPQIVGGAQFDGAIPLRLRDVSVTINRPSFIVNPTSCAPLGIGATITSAQGASATGLSPFQATGCGALPFGPKMRMQVTGNAQTTDGGHPTLITTVTAPTGQANVRSATVTLPLSLALDPYNSQHVCSVAASNTDTCPANTSIGSAIVRTPLLNQPLSGPAYLVQGVRKNAQGQSISTLPAMLITLRGQVALDLRGQTSVDSHSRLVTTFPAVPDAAMSSFTLTVTGGPKGILVVTHGASLCRGSQLATTAFAAQSGASENLSVPISAPCAKRAVVKRLKVRLHTVRLLVAMPAAGGLRVGGQGLATVRRKSARAKTVSLTLHLTRGAAARLQRKGKLRMRVRIYYTPRGFPTQDIVTRIVTIRS